MHSSRCWANGRQFLTALLLAGIQSGLALAQSECDTGLDGAAPSDDCANSGSGYILSYTAATASGTAVDVLCALFYRADAEFMGEVHTPEIVASNQQSAAAYYEQASQATGDCFGDGPLPVNFQAIANCIRDTISEDGPWNTPRAVVVFATSSAPATHGSFNSMYGGSMLIFNADRTFTTAIHHSGPSPPAPPTDHNPNLPGTYAFQVDVYLFLPVALRRGTNNKKR